MARIGMTLLPRRVAEHTNRPQDQVPGYRTFFNAAVAGRFPAELANNRWSVDEADLPKVATAMGLSAAKPAATAPRTSRKAASDRIAA